jgi:hypothetical protein
MDTRRNRKTTKATNLSRRSRQADRIKGGSTVAQVITVTPTRTAQVITVLPLRRSF